MSDGFALLGMFCIGGVSRGSQDRFIAVARKMQSGAF
ncbi:hypothetical protein X759_00055 [Mesorhizobium sp. LSHC420B00]|nr:hypothetical protein X759_00055 [Mesorhizobium sp. LSHC420B00]